MRQHDTDFTRIQPASCFAPEQVSQQHSLEHFCARADTHDSQAFIPLYFYDMTPRQAHMAEFFDSCL